MGEVSETPSRRAETATLVVAVCAVTILAGFLFKAQCAGDWDGKQYERLCYTDIKALYGARGISDGTFPYVNGHLEGGDLVGGAIEYPVLTGVFMWASGRFVPAGNVDRYVAVSALLLAPFGLVVAHLLQLMRGRRALLWAAAPALVLYSFHNWDLLAVAAATAGMWWWSRDRPGLAGIAFGLGAAFKMYPALFLIPLALDRLALRDREGAFRGLGGGMATAAIVNTPFSFANFDGWWATYAFHQQRGPNYDAIWTWLPEGIPNLTPPQLNLVTTSLTALFLVAVWGYAWIRGRAEGKFPFLQACAASLAVFLLWNKVHSPQYALWLLPFFVLVRVHVLWWVAYTLVDLMVYVGVFRFFYDLTIVGDEAASPWRAVMVTGVWLRAALLLSLCVAFLIARRADEDDAAEVRVTLSSQPPAKVASIGATSTGRHPA